MKFIVTFLGLSLGTIAAFGGQSPPTCPAMDDAASAIAKINGATFSVPSYRLAETPVATDQGQAYTYQFDALYSRGDELPNTKVGTIKVTALRKTGETLCKVLSVEYFE